MNIFIITLQGGENVKNEKNKFLLIVSVFVFAIVICGSASATENYDIGELVTKNAISDPGLNFSSADDVLCISNGGSAHYKNMSTEGSLQGVVDTTSSKPDKQKISVGKGNLIGISDPLGTLSFTFVTKKGNKLMAKQYLATTTGSELSITSSRTVDISSHIGLSDWNKAKTELRTNSFEIVSIANAWASGAPFDLLRIAGSSGGVSQGLLSGYVMSKSINQNYPLLSDSESYHIITTPGGGDDNVPQYLLELTPLKWVRDSNKISYFNYMAMDNGDPNQAAYIWWNRASQTGVLILMSSQNLKSQFNTETGISVVSGTISEIKFNNWLLNKLNNNPATLISINSLKTINKENFDYLWSKGIDKDYINSLSDENKAYLINNVLTPNDYNNMYNIGEQAALLAKNVLKFQKGDSDLAVLTSAGYVLLNGVSTQGALDGAISVTGTTISNLMNLKRAMWQPLWFTFVKKDGAQLNAIVVNYVNGALIASPIYDISAEALKNNAYAKSVSAAFSGGAADKPYFQQDYYIVSLANQWAAGVPYDYQISGIGGGCPGSGLSQGYLIANYVLNKYPLAPGQQYITISIPAHCKEQVIMDSLGVSSALGTYYTLGLSGYSSNANLAGIFILWSESTHTGKAIVLDMDRNLINAMQNQDVGSNNYYYKTMYWALWYLEKAFPGTDRYEEALGAFKVRKEISINQKELSTMLAAGGDPVQFVLNYVVPVNPPTDNNTNPTDPTTNPTTDPSEPEKPNSPVTQSTTSGEVITALDTVLTDDFVSEPTKEVASRLPLEKSTSSTTQISGMSTAMVTLLLLSIFVLGVYFGRENIISTLKKSEKLGK
jgi:formylmethanofuran dehydrogenase subunit E-like metal-binding protein